MRVNPVRHPLQLRNSFRTVDIRHRMVAHSVVWINLQPCAVIDRRLHVPQLLSGLVESCLVRFRPSVLVPHVGDQHRHSTVLARPSRRESAVGGPFGPCEIVALHRLDSVHDRETARCGSQISTVFLYPPEKLVSCATQ